MERARNVILVGMMGAGKTTVGRALARRLQRRFVDCDHELEARTGVRVPTIFEIEGEAGFRRRESQLLAELLAGTGLVLATGGGVVTDAENRRCLAQHGLVVYLRVPPQHLWERLRHDRGRPLLQVADPRGRIEELFRQRDPLYLEVADLVIEGGRTSAAAVARQIEKEVSTRCAA